MRRVNMYIAVLGTSIGLQSYGQLAPLPGTILATNVLNNSISQYDGTTGEMLGTLQVSAPVGVPIGLLGIAWNGADIVVTAFGTAGEVSGSVNASTGHFTPLTSVGFATLAHRNGNYFRTVEDGDIDVYSSTFQYLNTISLAPAGGFTGVLSLSTTATGFAVMDISLPNRIYFVGPDGFPQTSRPINDEPSVFQPWALEINPLAGDAWIGETNGTSSRLKYFPGQTSDSVWTVNVPGIIRDLAYIPIPAPATLPVVAAACITLRRRRALP